MIIQLIIIIMQCKLNDILKLAKKDERASRNLNVTFIGNIGISQRYFDDRSIQRNGFIQLIATFALAQGVKGHETVKGHEATIVQKDEELNMASS